MTMIRYLLVAMLLVLPLRVGAADAEIHVAGGVVCDSQAQVERLVSLVREAADPQHAISVVNREAANPQACGTALIGFSSARQIGVIRDHGQTFRLLELTVVAIPTGAGWSMIQPITQYAAFPVDEIEV
jgi:hypothetical protein